MRTKKVPKTHTTLSVDPDLLRQAKVVGLNLSAVFEEALMAKLTEQQPEVVALRLEMERRRIQEEMKELEKKMEEIEEKAVSILGTTLDNFLEKRKLIYADRKQKAIDVIVERLIQVDPFTGRPERLLWDAEKIVNVYGSVLRDYGIERRELRSVAEEALRKAQERYKEQEILAP